MEDALTCEVCMDRFSPGNHDPVFLCCGHTFCRGCLINVEKEEIFLCPTCRRYQGDVDVNDLPINYKVLNLLAEVNKVKHETCSTHGDDLAYWCQTCGQQICFLCITSGHPPDHKVVKEKWFIAENRSLLEIQIKDWKKTVELKMAEKLEKVVEEFKSWCKNEAEFSTSCKNVDELLEHSSNILQVQTFQEVESKIGSLMLDPEVCTGESKEMIPQSSALPLSNVNQRKRSYYIQNNNGMKAPLMWQDGMLLMSSFSNTRRLDCDLLLRMPRDVFLELSIEDKCLGRVIIQPWYHLRRAQQFVALCIGSYGISYEGSSFACVRFKGEPREYILGGRYLSTHDKIPTWEDLMAGLEWGGEATGEFFKGVVMGAGRDGISVESGESGFGICTRGECGGVLNCPFGEVRSGLDIVKKAVQHNPVTEVTITRCGVIVSNLNDGAPT